ncbi:uncharacterized protein LOC143314537 [Chaetodon auriga]|uniref:uncharacterized protein LOC143314537 n=1 Tax=Chaetodon auriga TaxID=39042 RepID=UPI004032A6F1
MNRSQQALNMSGTSQTKIYDVRLMSSVNALSNRVLGSALLPEFIPPGKPTGERIAVEYLLAQSNRGDLLSAQSEIGAVLPEMLSEVQEDECPDVTIPQATDIQSSFQESTIESGASQSPVSSPFEESGPITSAPESRCDPEGIPGWEAVDALAGYLVSLNRTITALSNSEIAEILRLYSCLDPIDKSPTKYTLKSKRKTLPGPWRASRKRSGSAPGQQAAERLFMVHGQAAHRPDHNRICECVALRLYKEFREARNRPKDNRGKTFAIPQSIVMTYCHIKQLIEDCKEILDNSNLVLVTINNTTVSSWLQDRQKRTDRDSLLQGVQLPQQVQLAEESLLGAQDLPSEPVQHGHTVMEFQEPENREGEAVIRRRRCARTQVSTGHTDTGGEIFSARSNQGDDARSVEVALPASSDLAYCEQGQHPVPASHSRGWSPYQLPPTPESHSQGWSPYLPPSAPVSEHQGRSPYQPPPSPESPNQGWSSNLPPPAQASHLPGWTSYLPPSTPESHSQGWSPYLPPSAPVSEHQGRSPYQPPPPPEFPNQGWSSNLPPPAQASHSPLPASTNATVSLSGWPS